MKMFEIFVAGFLGGSFFSMISMFFDLLSEVIVPEFEGRDRIKIIAIYLVPIVIWWGGLFWLIARM